MTRNPIARLLRATRTGLATRRGWARTAIENQELIATLEDAREDLMDAIELSSDAYAFFDSDDRLVRCNKRYHEYFAHDDAVVVPGTSFESILRRSALKRFAPEQRADGEARIRRRLRSHREPEGTFEHQLPDGRWLKTTDYKTARGTVFTLHADITDEKHSMRAAEEREQRRVLQPRGRTNLWLYRRGGRRRRHPRVGGGVASRGARFVHHRRSRA